MYEEQNKSVEVPAELEFLAGEEMKTKTNFWVAVFNGEKPPKMITEIHQQKVAVKVEVSSNVASKSITRQLWVPEYFCKVEFSWLVILRKNLDKLPLGT